MILPKTLLMYAFACRPQWSKEHVVPKSLLKEYKGVANDPANIIAFPRRLNNARSNHKYIDWSSLEAKARIKTVFPCLGCQNASCQGVGYSTKEGFIPPDTFRPAIAEAVLQMASRYPHIRPVIQRRVLDLDLALAWKHDQSTYDAPSCLLP